MLMRDWPHSPVHRLSEAGTYMVTAGTYKKDPLFRSARRLEFLCDLLLEVAYRHGWELQAWAIFPNHYHFIGVSPGSGESLRKMVQELHSVSGREVNRLDGARGRKVWFEYWETQLTFRSHSLPGSATSTTMRCITGLSGWRRATLGAQQVGSGARRSGHSTGL